MCGIAGVLGNTDRRIIDAMVATMQHRGPDDSGIWVDHAKRVMLGNRRLAIQDLSPAGHMPMTDGQCWITYNGEVYNFLSLRAELAKQGHVFSSGSDTEVILAAYRQWGTGCLDRLRGMFAFAIYDPIIDGGRLFLARDHFGIKPLYWSQQGDTLLFASEIRALLASGLIPRRLNPTAIWDYLSVGSVIQPNTIVSDVFALLPGHAMIISQGNQHVWQWWDLAEASQSTPVPNSFEEAARETRRLLDESVQLQRIADVPVGAFLSGGIDSSAIVGLMSAHVSEPIRTFSVAFTTPSNYPNEFEYARKASERFGTIHHEIIVNEDEVAKRFDTMLQALDQPSIDGINSYLVSEAAHHHIVVSLSGLGGDELFAGYPQFGRFLTASRWFPHGNAMLEKSVQRIGKYLPGRLRIPLQFLAVNTEARHSMIRLMFTEKQKMILLNEEVFASVYQRKLIDTYASMIRDGLDPIAQTSYIETRGYMAHTLLRDVDAMSMAHSLEVRVPFLDHELAKFVFALPPEWKWSNGRGKLVLRRALSDILPRDLIWRSKKGFDLPVTNWVSGVLQTTLHDALSSPSAKTLLSVKGIQTLHNGDIDRGGFRKWSLLTLLHWIDLMEMEM